MCSHPPPLCLYVYVSLDTPSIQTPPNNIPHLPYLLPEAPPRLLSRGCQELRWDLGDEIVHGDGFLGLEEDLCWSREDIILCCSLGRS